MSKRQLVNPTLRNWLAIGFLVLIASGCATPLQSERIGEWEIARQSIEISSTPFFPQERYQCGPAALATVLNYSGVSTTPDALRDQVYIPGREGSLQIEILATARRHGRIPYVLNPNLEDLLLELRGGHPVLVLQNLGLNWAPQWHYAVVIGFDALDQQIILRSGTLERHTMPVKLFERTWRRGNYWAVRLLRPGELPVNALEQRYLQAVVPFERLGDWQATEAAYGAALSRWPRSLVALMGLGNSLYASGHIQQAADAFRDAVEYHPESAAAHNNLAYTLAKLGQTGEAKRYAEKAVELDGRRNPEYLETLNSIDSTKRK